MLDVVEIIIHGPLKGSSIIFKAKRHFPIFKRTAGTNKVCLTLIFLKSCNFIIAQESIHEGEYLISITFINNLIYKWSGEIIFREDLLRSLKSMHTHIVPCFFSTETGIETHSIRAIG